jgi:hypothetical protein
MACTQDFPKLNANVLSAAPNPNAPAESQTAVLVQTTHPAPSVTHENPAALLGGLEVIQRKIPQLGLEANDVAEKQIIHLLLVRIVVPVSSTGEPSVAYHVH